MRRLKRSKGLQPAVYVRVGVETEPLPFEDMRLVEVIASVSSGRELTQTELVVAVLESGYETTMTRQAFRNTVGVELRKDSKRFRDNGGKWTVV